MPYKDPDKAAEARRENYLKNKQTFVERAAHWKKRYPDAAKLQARRAKLKQRFGITLEQYDELLERQNGCCGVCKRPAEQFRISLAVDHDHQTGAIRGLLCTYCNRVVIGRLRGAEGGLLLSNASEYLTREETGWFIPAKKKRKKRGKKTKARTQIRRR